MILYINHTILRYSGISSVWDDMTPDGEYRKPTSDDPEQLFLDPESALNIFGDRTTDESESQFHRKRRGIVDECCRKACTIKELYSYCE